jgi:hypothetical protein
MPMPIMTEGEKETESGGLVRFALDSGWPIGKCLDMCLWRDDQDKATLIEIWYAITQ